MPTIISRADAKRAGLKRFFTGVPCRKGHLAERYVSHPICVECVRRHSTTRDDKLKDSDQFMATNEAWVALDTRDHFALLQLLDRAERAGEARGLVIFLRGLLKQDDLPAVVATSQAQARQVKTTLRAVRKVKTTLRAVRKARKRR